MFPWLMVLILLEVPEPDPSPSLADLERFPSYQVAIVQYMRSGAHLKRLKEERHVHADDGRFERWIAEAEALYNFWDWLTDAQLNHFSEEVRVSRLVRVQQLIGSGAYDRGWTPELLPAGVTPEVVWP